MFRIPIALLIITRSLLFSLLDLLFSNEVASLSESLESYFHLSLIILSSSFLISSLVSCFLTHKIK